MTYSASQMARQLELKRVCLKAAATASDPAEKTRLANTAAYYQRQWDKMLVINECDARGI